MILKPPTSDLPPVARSAARTGLPRAALLGAGLVLASGACVATTAVIGVECGTAPGVNGARAAEICAGFGAALRAAYPDRRFAEGAGPPGLRVTVIAAGETENGLALSWILPDGSAREGRPFQTSVSDKKPSAGKTASGFARLFDGFLGLNPLPF